jgi:hypothetical protein
MSESEAYVQAARILKSKNAPAMLRAYKCPVCNWYHLTKREKHDNLARIHS